MILVKYMTIIRRFQNHNSSFVETNEIDIFIQYYLCGGGCIKKENINNMYKDINELINMCILNIESRLE